MIGAPAANAGETRLQLANAITPDETAS